MKRIKFSQHNKTNYITCQYLTSITQNAQSGRIPYLVVVPAAKKLEISYQINYMPHDVNALRY
jgi:hypothetical protein